jgi:hypothetical protein
MNFPFVIQLMDQEIIQKLYGHGYELGARKISTSTLWLLIFDFRLLHFLILPLPPPHVSEIFIKALPVQCLI